MARNTPTETFAEAQAAMTNGDWDGFFATLDRDDLMKIAANGVNRLIGQGPNDAGILLMHLNYPRDCPVNLGDLCSMSDDPPQMRVVLDLGVGLRRQSSRRMKDGNWMRSPEASQDDRLQGREDAQGST